MKHSTKFWLQSEILVLALKKMYPILPKNTMTTRQEKLQAITKAIKKTVPNIESFSFGSIKGKKTHYVIIGICEIMLWLQTVNFCEYAIETNGLICKLSYGEIVDDITIYNLHKDRLEQQSDELIDFLFNFTQS